MSAILSADDLNDFISPGVACIKPVETLPKQLPETDKAYDPYEVTTEDKVAHENPAANAPPAQISLTDCLACSGCVTSAEAVLVSLQSHQEVLNTLDTHSSLSVEEAAHAGEDHNGLVFVASVSPQARASLAATYGVSEQEAGCMISQLLSGPGGLKSGGRHGSGFTWVVDTNTVREISHAAGIQEVVSTLSHPQQASVTINGHAHDRPKAPVLSSACPGWICYVEKTHPHVIPHISRLKSPQALAGTLLKSVLCRRFGVAPDRIWHVAIMPCFDKKLEASREELTDFYWRPDATEKRGARDVDCVITARELLMLAESRGVSFPAMPKTPLDQTRFPDPTTDRFLFPRGKRRAQHQEPMAGPSGGYAYYFLQELQARNLGSELKVQRGRNPDLIEYILCKDGLVVAKTARYFGFQNIQNLVRKLKPAKKSRLPGSRQRMLATSGAGAMSEYAYVEVMACPGGCTNGGGQVKVDDLPGSGSDHAQGKRAGPREQKQWLARVDEAYYSAESSDDGNDIDDNEAMDIDRVGRDETSLDDFLKHWSSITDISLEQLLYTSYRQVDSDVGKKQSEASTDMDRVAELASSVGGSW